MTQPSRSARRFRSRLRLQARIRGSLLSRRAWRSAGHDLFTVVALALTGGGIVAWTDEPGAGLTVVGVLLLLLTPVGVAFRILVRGK